MNKHCLFCKIIAGEVPAEILYEDDEFLAFRDISPQAPVHFLVIPKKHIVGPAFMEAEDEQLIGRMMRVGSQLAADLDLVDGFRLIFNNGAAAGQTVFHIHLHILGGRQLLWPPG
ncbi:MAG: histidine triad nucleotide-binding protein [Desulfobulbaceae bacterium]